MSINSAVISGNITAEPELRKTAEGACMLTFSVAVNDRVKDANGEWGDRPNYIDCVMFGKRAEGISKHIGRGTKVVCKGKLRQSKWDHNGQTRSRVSINVEEIEFAFKAAAKNAETAQQGDDIPDLAALDDIPF